MSTHDVPGANPANGDQLKQGCWAEAPDGSLLYVTDTENGRVIYSVFDLSKKRVIEYRDAMDQAMFKRIYTSPKSGGASKTIWTWHDKSPFPWDAVIKSGAEDGARLASADAILEQAEEIAESRRRIRTGGVPSAAERIADDEGLTGAEVVGADIRRRAGQTTGEPVPAATRRLAHGLAQLLDQYFSGR